VSIDLDPPNSCFAGALFGAAFLFISLYGVRCWCTDFYPGGADSEYIYEEQDRTGASLEEGLVRAGLRRLFSKTTVFCLCLLLAVAVAVSGCLPGHLCTDGSAMDTARNGTSQGAMRKPLEDMTYSGHLNGTRIAPE